jgi:hypothetical protein
MRAIGRAGNWADLHVTITYQGQISFSQIQEVSRALDPTMIESLFVIREQRVNLVEDRITGWHFGKFTPIVSTTRIIGTSLGSRGCESTPIICHERIQVC